MGDWWHSVPFQTIVTVVAYLGGVLTKPLQNYIDAKQKGRALRNALYVELASNLNFLAKIYQETEGKKEKYQGLRTLNPFISCECFDEASKQPTSFNQLREAVPLRRLYALLETLRSAGEIDTEVVWGVCDTFLLAVGGFCAQKRLSSKRLLKLLSPSAKGYVADAQQKIQKKALHFDPL